MEMCPDAWFYAAGAGVISGERRTSWKVIKGGKCPAVTVNGEYGGMTKGVAIRRADLARPSKTDVSVSSEGYILS